MFHAREGLFFEKQENGAVRVLVTETAHEGANTVKDLVLDKDTWASVIATMSFYGEEDYGFYRAANFHVGEPYHDNEAWSMANHVRERESNLLKGQP